MHMHGNILAPVRHGLMLSVLAMVLGALWAGFLAVQHERLHGGFAEQEARQTMSSLVVPQGYPSGTTAGHHHEAMPAAPGAMHVHSGSLADDAMRRLLRGHIHFMGLGTLAAVLLLVTAVTSLKRCWKAVLGWSFGIGALAYPPAWILMGFRTVDMGPEAAEASVMWLFGPSVGLLLVSMVAVLGVLAIEQFGWQRSALFGWAFRCDDEACRKEAGA